jgi:hypothetical protein
MRYVYVLLIAAVCMTGCTARQATTTTVGFIAAGAAGAFGIDVDPYMFSSMAESTADLGFETADEVKKAKAAKKAEELTTD